LLRFLLFLARFLLLRVRFLLLVIARNQVIFHVVILESFVGFSIGVCQMVRIF